MTKFFYITTPIFYPNDRLHLGHAYNIVMSDIIARYKKSKGYQVYFQTGSDEHGEKIEKKANSLGISPQELVDKNILLFQQLWRELGVFEHIFYRTSSTIHKEKVQKIFTELLNKGDIYLGEYQGKYCISCEDYVSDSKVINGDFCPAPNCQAELRKINEPAYFLRTSKYYSQLIEYYQKNSDFFWPDNAKKELFSNFLKENIPDLCITRSDIKWGITVPNQKKMVIYVWFEALLNYLSSEPGEKFFLSELSNEKKINNAKEVACVVIQNKNNDYLLVYNKKYQHWQFPGGKLEKGENAEEAAKREIFEETNLVVEDLEKIGENNFYINNTWWKFYFYRTEKYSGELLIKEKETIGKIRFLEINKIQEINNQDQDEITKYLLGKINNEEPNNYEIIHLIGKEITRFHAIYWPIILFSLHKRLPNKILAHGWLTTPQGKMSKSKGNVIDPLELLKNYPPDLLRAYFIAKINFLQDGVCDENLLKDFYHDFLVNNLSNLVSRVNKMLHLYNEGVVPEIKHEQAVKNEKLEKYQKKCKFAVKEFQNKMNQYELTTAFSQIQNLLNESNKLISDLAPWELVKKDDIILLNYTLNYLSTGIKIIAFLLNSITPETSQKILDTFNISRKKINWGNCLDFNFMDGIKVKLLEKHLYEPLK